MPENSPGHGKRMLVATNDPMAPYWIQQCCKQQGIFHGIQWISNTDELLAELKKFNADAAFVDMDFIGEKLMRFLNDLAVCEVDVPIILVSSCEPRIFHAVADYARSLALNIVCAISRSRMAREVPVGPRRRVSPGRSCRSREQG
jgi:two-component SAPR family response regulator